MLNPPIQMKQNQKPRTRTSHLGDGTRWVQFGEWVSFVSEINTVSCVLEMYALCVRANVPLSNSSKKFRFIEMNPEYANRNENKCI